MQAVRSFFPQFDDLRPDPVAAPSRRARWPRILGERLGQLGNPLLEHRSTHDHLALVACDGATTGPWRPRPPVGVRLIVIDHLHCSSSPGPVGALAGTNGRVQRRLDSPSGPGPCRFPGRCRRRDLGDRCLGAAPFWRTGTHRSWPWQLPSPRAWARQPSAQPRATGTAGSSDRHRRTLRPSPQSARSDSGSGFVELDRP